MRERNADRAQIWVDTTLKLHEHTEGAVVEQEAEREAPERRWISVRLTVEQGHLLFILLSDKLKVFYSKNNLYIALEFSKQAAPEILEILSSFRKTRS